MPLLIAFLLLISAGWMSAFGQTDTGIFFDTPQTCVNASEGTFSIYQPKFTNRLGWWREMVALEKAEEVKDHGKEYCAEEFTVIGWRIIRWPVNNPYFKTPEGKMADGRCGNEVRRIWEIPKSVPPPSPAPTTGFVAVTKLAFGPDGDSIAVPTGVFEIRIGTHLVPLDANGKGEIEIPAGTYEVFEKFDEKVWEWIYVSARTFTVRAGETVNIELKNRQRRSAAAPASHTCSECLGFESVDAEGYGVELDSVTPTTPRFSITGRFAGGPVTDHKWTINGGPEILGEKLGVVPENLQPGPHRIRLTAKDGDGHEVVCETTVMLTVPPPASIPTAKRRRLIPCWNWPFGRASLPICAAGAVGGYALAGGFAAGAVGTKIPTAVAVGLVP